MPTRLATTRLVSQNARKVSGQGASAGDPAVRHSDTSTSDDVVFRLAKLTDAPAVRTILNTAYAERWGKRGLHVKAATQNEARTRAQIERGDVYVLLHNGDVAGTVRVERKRLHDGEVIAYVTHLARRAESVGLHFGQRLMAEAEEVARDFGASRMTLDTAEELDDLVGFYRELGYESTGRFMHTQTDFWSLWFEKILKLDQADPLG